MVKFSEIGSKSQNHSKMAQKAEKIKNIPISVTLGTAIQREMVKFSEIGSKSQNHSKMAQKAEKNKLPHFSHIGDCHLTPNSLEIGDNFNSEITFSSKTFLGLQNCHPSLPHLHHGGCLCGAF